MAAVARRPVGHLLERVSAADQFDDLFGRLILVAVFPAIVALDGFARSVAFVAGCGCGFVGLHGAIGFACLEKRGRDLRRLHC